MRKEGFRSWIFIAVGAVILSVFISFYTSRPPSIEEGLASGVGRDGKCIDIGHKQLKPNKPGKVTINLCPGSKVEFTVADGVIDVFHRPRPGEPNAAINWDLNKRCRQAPSDGYDAVLCRQNVQDWRGVLWAKGTYQQEAKWPAGLRIFVSREVNK